MRPLPSVLPGLRPPPGGRREPGVRGTGSDGQTGCNQPVVILNLGQSGSELFWLDPDMGPGMQRDKIVI